MAIAAVSISPIGEGPSVGGFVAEALRVVRDQDRVRFALGPMFTTLEGDLDEILALVRRMQEAVFAAGAKRVSTVLKIDDRRDRRVHMEDKVRAVEEQLAEDRVRARPASSDEPGRRPVKPRRGRGSRPEPRGARRPARS